MSYINGMVAAVPRENMDSYLEHARSANAVFKEYGATECVEAWGDDVPHGQVTDFHRAVQATEDETIVFSWITWPDKATHDAGWEKVMKDPRMSDMQMPFDGKRMIYGGFEVMLES